jgi:hypothetical protein
MFCLLTCRHDMRDADARGEIPYDILYRDGVKAKLVHGGVLPRGSPLTEKSHGKLFHLWTKHLERHVVSIVAIKASAVLTLATQQNNSLRECSDYWAHSRYVMCSTSFSYKGS